MSLLPSILCFFLSFMLHCVLHVFFVPSFLSFFLSPPPPTSLLVYLNYLEEHSALPQLPLKDTLREGPSYLWHLSLAHSNKALSSHHIAGSPQLRSPLHHLSTAHWVTGTTLPGLGEVGYLFRHTELQPLFSLQLLANSSTNPAIILKFILKH